VKSLRRFLQALRTGEIRIEPATGIATVYLVELPGGRVVYMAIGRPAAGDPDSHADLFVQDIWWPEDVN